MRKPAEILLLSWERFLRSSVAMGARSPQPQSGRVTGIAEIRGEKLEVVGYRIILAKQITLKYVF